MSCITSSKRLGRAVREQVLLRTTAVQEKSNGNQSQHMHADCVKHMHACRLCEAGCRALEVQSQTLPALSSKAGWQHRPNPLPRGARSQSLPFSKEERYGKKHA